MFNFYYSFQLKHYVHNIGKNYKLGFKKNNYLSTQQCGFWKNKSTIDNLIQINYELNQTSTNKQIMGLFNLHISKQYIN